jgi:putative DNA primase/helicase
MGNIIKPKEFQDRTISMDKKPERMLVDFNRIPYELLDKPNWVLWRYVWRTSKWTKPLFQISGELASSTNPKTWSSFSQVASVYHGGRFDGIGYVFSANDSYVGIDWDDCRNPETGEVQPDILDHIKLLNTYTEDSPSGCGFKSLCRGRLPRGGHHGKQVGVFEKSRYFCITGNVFSEVSTQIEERQSELNTLIKNFWPKDFKQKESHAFTTFNHNLTDSDIIQKALNSNDAKFYQLWGGDISGYTSHSEADQALCNKLAFWTGKDSTAIDTLFRQSGLNREKWERREDYRNKTIQNAIDFTQEEYRPRIIIKSTRNGKPTYEKFRNFFD